MVRLKNSETGAVVNVDDGTASRLGAQWVDPSAPNPDGTPRGNASREDWAAHADSLGIEYPEGAKRSEIKSLIAARPVDDDTDEDDDEDDEGADDESSN